MNEKHFGEILIANLYTLLKLIQQKRSTMNVYERLASGVLRPPNLTQRTVIQSDEVPSGGRGLMFPRCAMDLPQTKVFSKFQN